MTTEKKLNYDFLLAEISRLKQEQQERIENRQGKIEALAKEKAALLEKISAALVEESQAEYSKAADELRKIELALQMNETLLKSEKEKKLIDLETFKEYKTALINEAETFKKDKASELDEAMRNVFEKASAGFTVLNKYNALIKDLILNVYKEEGVKSNNAGWTIRDYPTARGAYYRVANKIQSEEMKNWGQFRIDNAKNVF